MEGNILKKSEIITAMVSFWSEKYLEEVIS